MSLNTIDECSICFSKNIQKGVTCKKCHQNTCLDCEQKLDSCPFCRTHFPEWFNRISSDPKTFEYRLKTHMKEVYDKSVNYKKNKIRFRLIINNGKYTEKILPGISDDDCVDILNILQYYMFYTFSSLNLEEIEYIEDIITYMEYRLPENIVYPIIRRIENLDVSERLEYLLNKENKQLFFINLKEQKNKEKSKNHYCSNINKSKSFKGHKYLKKNKFFIKNQ